jgi:hypothetical protein
MTLSRMSRLLACPFEESRTPNVSWYMAIDDVWLNVADRRKEVDVPRLLTIEVHSLMNCGIAAESIIWMAICRQTLYPFGAFRSLSVSLWISRRFPAVSHAHSSADICVSLTRHSKGRRINDFLDAASLADNNPDNRTSHQLFCSSLCDCIGFAKAMASQFQFCLCADFVLYLIWWIAWRVPSRGVIFIQRIDWIQAAIFHVRITRDNYIHYFSLNGSRREKIPLLSLDDLIFWNQNPQGDIVDWQQWDLEKKWNDLNPT